MRGGVCRRGGVISVMGWFVVLDTKITYLIVCWFSNFYCSNGVHGFVIWGQEGFKCQVR